MRHSLESPANSNTRPGTTVASATDMNHDAPLADWLRLVRAEFREMPGMKLTKPQARKLWGLDNTLCDALFESLVMSGFLVRTGANAYTISDRP
jgi:hypothetical protein